MKVTKVHVSGTDGVVNSIETGERQWKSVLCYLLGNGLHLEILEDTKIQNEFYLFHYSLLSDGILVLSGVSKKHFCDLGKWPIFPGKP